MSLYYEQARNFSITKLDELKTHLAKATLLAEGKACVYATGSFGRLEAGPFSDLDLFIISDQGKGSKPLLGGIDSIRLKAELIRSVDELSLPPFDGDGKFLDVHLLNDFVKELGSREDDAKNTLTGRLLLLLESQILIGNEIFQKLLDRVIERYFRDFEGHENDFVPSFIVNDILRMWRTFCVNYEYWRRRGEVSSKIKNLKLKYNRLLTCYSAILYILWTFERSSTTTPDDIRTMVSLTPTQRLESIRDAAGGTLASSLSRALGLYSEFLEIIHTDKKSLEEKYPAKADEWRVNSHEFAKSVTTCLIELGVGGEGELQRIIIV